MNYRKKEKKQRNWHALNAIQRHAGPMKDKKKDKDKTKCRGIDEEVDNDTDDNNDC